jgi:hypothetical protein
MPAKAVERNSALPMADINHHRIAMLGSCQQPCSVANSNSATPTLHGSAQMENPTKAITATLRTIIAIAATSMMESRLRSNAMMRYWAAVERWH